MNLERTPETLEEYRRKLNMSETYSQIVMPIMDLLQHNTLTFTNPDGSPVDVLMDSREFLIHGKDPDLAARTMCLNTLLRNCQIQQLVSPSEAVLYQKLLDNFKILDPDDASEDPYFRNIKIPNAACGSFAIGHDDFAAGEYDMYDVPDPSSGEYGLYVPKIGVWDRPFRYPVASQNGATWMTITPNETSTMKKPIEDAHGDALTLGLGLGYFAYMAHRKPDVNSVTVVEIDPDIIELFTDHILPQFDHPEKVKIIQADAVEYIRNLKDGVFDTCFADIWKDSLDVGLYLAVRTAARHLKRTQMSYWIEDSILGYLIQFMSFNLMDAAGLPHPEMHDDPVYRFLHKLTSRTHIKTPEDMRRVFTPEYLSGLIDTRTSVRFRP